MKDQVPFSLYPFQPKKITLDGGEISYIEEGKGQTVVMLHGNPTWSFFYRNLINSLQKDFRCVAPDHMGCGLSDKPQDYCYTLSQHIDNLAQLLRTIPGPYSLIVHDWGGAIGFGYAVRYPEKINKLIVMNTAAFRSQRIPTRIRICRTPIIGPFLIRGLNGFARPALSMAVSKRMSTDVCRGYLAPYGSWHDRVAINSFVQDIPLEKSHPSYSTLTRIEERLSLLQDKSMLLLWGGKDFCFDKKFYTEWQNRFPKAESHYFSDAGHYLLEDAFLEIQPLIAQFMRHDQ